MGHVSSLHFVRGMNYDMFLAEPDAAGIHTYFKGGGVGSLQGVIRGVESYLRPAALSAEMRMLVRMSAIVALCVHTVAEQAQFGRQRKPATSDGAMVYDLDWDETATSTHPSDYDLEAVLLDLERMARSLTSLDMTPASDFALVMRDIRKLAKMDRFSLQAPPHEPLDFSSSSSSSDDDESFPARRHRARVFPMPKELKRAIALEAKRDRDGDWGKHPPAAPFSSTLPLKYLPPAPAAKDKPSKSKSPAKPSSAADEKKALKRPASAPPPVTAKKQNRGERKSPAKVELDVDVDEEVEVVDDDRPLCNYFHKADKKQERGCPFYVAEGDRGAKCPIHKVIAAKQKSDSEKGKNLPVINQDQKDWAEAYGTGRYVNRSHVPGTSEGKVMRDFVKWRDEQGGDGQGAGTTPQPPSSSKGLRPSEILVQSRAHVASLRPVGVKASAGSQGAPPPPSKGAGSSKVASLPPAGTSVPPPKGAGTSLPPKPLAAIFLPGYRPPAREPETDALLQQLQKNMAEAEKKRADELAEFQKKIAELEEKGVANAAAKAAKAVTKAAAAAAEEAARVLAEEEAHQARLRAQMAALEAQMAASTEKKDKAAAVVMEEALKPLPENAEEEDGAEEEEEEEEENEEGEDAARTQSDKAEPENA